jgi:hypothetical protein
MALRQATRNGILVCTGHLSLRPLPKTDYRRRRQSRIMRTAISQLSRGEIAPRAHAAFPEITTRGSVGHVDRDDPMDRTRVSAYVPF